jgi:hypothetical protein
MTSTLAIDVATIGRLDRYAHGMMKHIATAAFRYVVTNPVPEVEGVPSVAILADVVGRAAGGLLEKTVEYSTNTECEPAGVIKSRVMRSYQECLVEVTGLRMGLEGDTLDEFIDSHMALIDIKNAAFGELDR